MEKKSNEPKLTQKQISKQLAFSCSTIQLHRDDVKWIGPIIERKTGRKLINQINQKLKSKLIQQVKTIKILKVKENKKNDLEGGSVLEKDHRDEKTKFNSEARRTKDND